VERTEAQRRDQAHLGCGAGRARDGDAAMPVFFPLSLSADLAAVALAPFPAILSEEAVSLGCGGGEPRTRMNGLAAAR
jgi:hypothetical protein